jgi:hypothetical protein
MTRDYFLNFFDIFFCRPVPRQSSVQHFFAASCVVIRSLLARTATTHFIIHTQQYLGQLIWYENLFDVHEWKIH